MAVERFALGDPDPAAEALRRLGVMRVATKYPRIAARWFEDTGRQAEIVEVKGSVELAPLTGLVEAIVDLTATEYRLLRYLMLNPRRVLTKGQILQNVWRYDFGGNSNVVETYVSYLRKKLDAAGPPLIKTVRQAGYMLELEQR